MASKRNHKIRSRKTYRDRIQAAARNLNNRSMKWWQRKMLGI